MNMTELNNILEKHKKWINRETDEERADLYMANISGANLSGANLGGANLSGADFSGANLSGADLSGANLYGANLSEANLSGANLSEANLRWADLRWADLNGANLYKTDIREADLREANLYKAKNIPSYICPINCPQEGSFIGFKQAYAIIETYKLCKKVIVKLRIPDDAKRSSATTRKCRCDKAEVISIISLDGKTEFEEACSIYDNTFIYKTGEVVSVNDFDENR